MSQNHVQTVEQTSKYWKIRQAIVSLGFVGSAGTMILGAVLQWMPIVMLGLLGAIGFGVAACVVSTLIWWNHG